MRRAATSLRRGVPERKVEGYLTPARCRGLRCMCRRRSPWAGSLRLGSELAWQCILVADASQTRGWGAEPSTRGARRKPSAAVADRRLLALAGGLRNPAAADSPAAALRSRSPVQAAATARSGPAA